MSVEVGLSELMSAGVLAMVAVVWNMITGRLRDHEARLRVIEQESPRRYASHEDFNRVMSMLEKMQDDIRAMVPAPAVRRASPRRRE